MAVGVGLHDFKPSNSGGKRFIDTKSQNLEVFSLTKTNSFYVYDEAEKLAKNR